MKIKLDKKQLTDFRGMITIISAICKESYFKVSADSLTLRAFDPSQAMYYQAVFKKEAFEEYEIDTETDGNIDLKVMDKSLKMFKSDLVLEFLANKIKLVSSSRKTSLDIYEVESVVREIELTDDKFESFMEIEADDYVAMLKDIASVDDSPVRFHVKPDSMLMKTDKIEVKPESNVNFISGDKTYSTRYNASFLKNTYINKIISTFVLKLGDTSPMCITANGNNVELNLMIAPLGDEN